MESEDSSILDRIQSNIESREEINTRTFTKWINSKLGAKEPVVTSLISDMQEGHVLLSLLEVLLKIRLRPDKGKLMFHKLNNVKKAFQILEEQGLKLHGINVSGIVNGNKKSILGLLWIVILHFQVQGVVLEENNNERAIQKLPTPKKNPVPSPADVEKLLIKWAQGALNYFSDVVSVDDILKSWQDGLAFTYLLFVYRPSAVDVNKARGMTVEKRLQYAFDVAEKEFGVDSLLDPTDVEQGNVDKKAMLMYLSALYDVLRKLEPASVQTLLRELSKEPEEPKSEPNSKTVRIGDEIVKITAVSRNEIVLQYKTAYHNVLHTVKALEEKMNKIKSDEPCQENARALRGIQESMLELQPKIEELVNMNEEMAAADGVDRQEFSMIQAELGQLSGRLSSLVQQNDEQKKRQPKIVVEIWTSRTVHTARLKVDGEVIEITCVSANEIVIKYKVVYFEVNRIVCLIEGNIKVILDNEPTQKTAKLLSESKQRLEQLQPKIKELNELMSQMKVADGVDADEMSQLQSELSEFRSRLPTVTDNISREEKRQPRILRQGARVNAGDEVIEITCVSTNEIVIKYKVICYEVITIIRLIESSMKIILDEEPSQKSASLLDKSKKRLQQLQPMIKELNELMSQMEVADGVDPDELSELQSELADVDYRVSEVTENIAQEEKRQPTVFVGISTSTTGHITRLTVGDEMIEITCVSTNKIVIRFKFFFDKIIKHFRLIEANIKVILHKEPCQETARQLDESKQRLDELQSGVKELNELMSQMKVADGVDPDELSQLQSELADFNSRVSTVTENILQEKKRQPSIARRTSQFNIGDEVIKITCVSTNKIVMSYKVVYYEINRNVCDIEANIKVILDEEPSQKNARLLSECKKRLEELQPNITELHELMSQMNVADEVDPDELSELQSELANFDNRESEVTKNISQAEKQQPKIVRTTGRLTIEDEVFEITCTSTNKIVSRYKVVYYRIIREIRLIEANMKVIQGEKPSQKNAGLIDESKQRLLQLQPTIDELNGLMSRMKVAEDVDAEELGQLQSELSELHSKMDSLSEEIVRQKVRQPELDSKTMYIILHNKES